MWNDFGVPRSPELKQLLSPLFDTIKTRIRQRKAGALGLKIEDVRLAYYDNMITRSEEGDLSQSTPSTSHENLANVTQLSEIKVPISVFIPLEYLAKAKAIIAELASDPSTSGLRKPGSAPIFLHMMDSPYYAASDAAGEAIARAVNALTIVLTNNSKPFLIIPPTSDIKEDADTIRILDQRLTAAFLGAALGHRSELQRFGGDPTQAEDAHRTCVSTSPISCPDLQDLQVLLREMLEKIRGKRFEGVLTSYSSSILEQVASHLSKLWSTTGQLAKDHDHLHSQIDSLLYERRTGLSGLSIAFSVNEVTDQLYHFLRTSNGVDHAISVCESFRRDLIGNSRLMICQRLMFVQILGRAYEMKLNREHFLKAISLMESSLAEFDRLEQMETKLGSHEGVSWTVQERSKAAELCARIKAMFIKREVTNPEDRRRELISLLSTVSTWLAEDKRHALLDQAAWKTLIMAQCVFHLQDAEYVPSMEQYLMEATSLAENIAEPDRSQFFKELESVRVFIDSQGDKIDPSFDGIPNDGWDLRNVFLYHKNSAIMGGPVQGFCEKAIAHLCYILVWENRLTITLSRKEVNPLLVLRNLEICLTSLCKAYSQSFSICNFELIYFRPGDWAILTIQEQFLHLRALVKIQSLGREKIALTHGLNSLLRQIEFQNATDIVDSATLPLLWDGVKLASKLTALRGWKQTTMLAWEMWTIMQEMKARGLMSILSIGHFAPEIAQSSLGNAIDAECHHLLETERKVVKLLPVWPERMQTSLLQDLTKLRQKMSLKTALRPHLQICSNDPIDIDGLLELYRSGAFGRKVTFVDWFAVEDGFSVTTCRPSIISGLRINRTKVEVAAVSEWVSTYKSSSDLREHEAIEDLNALRGLVKPVCDYTDPGELLVLCATSILYSIPLHALSVGDADMPLIERNPVVYCHSLSTLRNLVNRFQHRQQHACLKASIFGDPTGGPISVHRTHSSDPPGQAFTGLPHGRASAHHLKETVQGSLHLGKDASTNAFCEAASDSTLVHYHGHAAYDMPEILDRGLVCSDGILSSRQMMGITMCNAPLVVLIACASGRQIVHVRDEPLGITPALLYAGASSVIGTMWPILDADGSKFSKFFYEALLGDPYYRKLKSGLVVADVARALQDAVLKLRLEPGYRSKLYHWGAYHLAGAPCTTMREQPVLAAFEVSQDTENWVYGEEFDFVIV